ncbi:hypothetical protein BGZ47_004872 [Haplosporangium gracile]|nr:hypothetical protein BGZ47_004872 [Haplosporangium gracile]
MRCRGYRPLSRRMMMFFDRRQWCDEIDYSSDIPYGSRHLRSLTVNLFTLEYEPSRFYETYKDLISDHPTIETFEIQFQRDSVETIFQRYAPLIERLEVDELSPKDATVLKSVRRKKKPLALKHLSVKDIHLMKPVVRVILQEIIVKGALEDVVIRESVIPQATLADLTANPAKAVQLRLTAKKETSIQAAKLEANVKIWGEFIVAIRHKVTELYWLEVLLEFKDLVPRDIDVPDEDPLEARIKGIFALRSQMTNVRAITDISLQEVAMDPKDWNPLLRYMDFSQVVGFEVRQTNALSKALLLHIAGFVR